MDNTIVIEGLIKSFGKLRVLDGIDFTCGKGEVLGLLGPNGAGKTTTVRILSTLLRPDRGRVIVNGFDVVREPYGVRGSIGLTGQYAAVDEYLSGRENLEMMGRLYRLSRKDTKRRTEDLIEQFDLQEASSRQVKTYSGGMRRRLDLAVSLVASPSILFLDEPTTGLDPRSRLMMWDMINELAAGETTILLTTQYMEEADRLADRIVVIDRGKVVTEGTPAELKARVGSERLEVVIAKGMDFARACEAVDCEGLRSDPGRMTLSISTDGGVRELKEVLIRLENTGIEVESVSLHRPTLDDVFLTLTGHKATVDNNGDPPGGEK